MARFIGGSVFAPRKFPQKNLALLTLIVIDITKLMLKIVNGSTVKNAEAMINVMTVESLATR